MKFAKSTLSLLALPLTLAITPAYAAEKFIGEIYTMAGSFCPEGSVEADGRMLQVQPYQALFSILGNRYGGDGRKEFALPDLRPDKKPWRHDQPRQCIVIEGGEYPPQPAD